MRSAVFTPPGSVVPRRRTGGVMVLLGAVTVIAALAPGGSSRAATSARKPAKPAGTVKPTTALPVTSARPVARGKLVVGTNGDFPGLDPAAVAVDVTNSGIGSAIYEELVDGSIGAAPKPGLASAYTEAPDRKSWTLTIRDGVTFHDGTKLDATAVKLNLERQRKSPVNALSMALIKSIDVVDPLTVRLILDKPYSAMPYLLAGNAGIMISPKAIAEHSDILNRAPTDAGTGPYVLKDWVPGDHLTVVRNPNYWETGKPYVDALKIVSISDPTARLNALLSGQIDAMSNLGWMYSDGLGVKRSDSRAFRWYQRSAKPRARPRSDRAPRRDRRGRGRARSGTGVVE